MEQDFCRLLTIPGAVRKCPYMSVHVRKSPFMSVPPFVGRSEPLTADTKKHRF